MTLHRSSSGGDDMSLLGESSVVTSQECTSHAGGDAISSYVTMEYINRLLSESTSSLNVDVSSSGNTGVSIDRLLVDKTCRLVSRTSGSWIGI